MKSQRSFVVEIKSGRRRPKAQASSIWGDTDFKALAREVEDDVPHALRAPQAPADAIEAPAVAEESVEASVPLSSDEDQAPAILAAETLVDSVQSDPPRKLSRRTASKQSPRPRVKTTPQRVDEPAAASVMTFEALMELEGVNLNLRALLRRQLEAENAELVRMLERMTRRSRNAG